MSFILPMLTKPAHRDTQRQLAKLPPSKRPVMKTWVSRDGRRYAFDGISIRRVQ